MRSSCQADVMNVIPRDGWPWWRHRTMVPLLWDSRSFVRYASSFVRYVRLREICAPPLKSAISCFTPTWIGNNLPWNDKEQVLQRLKDTINSFGNLVYINLKRALWNFTTFIAYAKLLSSCNNVKYSSKAKYCINILTWEPIQIEANTVQSRYFICNFPINSLLTAGQLTDVHWQSNKQMNRPTWLLWWFTASKKITSGSWKIPRYQNTF